MSIDGYLTAKREYCAACGGLLGSARYLTQSVHTGKYVAIHHTSACLGRFHNENQPPVIASADTSADGSAKS